MADIPTITAPATPSDDPLVRSAMQRAIELARRGWGRVSPNPLVGAVVLRDKIVVGDGWHAEYGDAHAEVMALRAAGPKAKGGILVVTLERQRSPGERSCLHSRSRCQPALDFPELRPN